MRVAILRALIEAEGYVSGQVLSQELQVSRTAIWKNIEILREEGYCIVSSRNKGYLLEKETTMLVVEGIKVHLGIDTIFKDIHVYSKVDSTNNQAKRLALDSSKSEKLIIANEQTNGKGRRGNLWISEKGTGIWMSMLVRPNIRPEKAPMLTLVAGLSVVEAVRQFTGLEAKIKWPNDVVINGSKICGILTEMNGERDYIQNVIIGVGINVNQSSFPKEIEDVATSLKLLTGKSINRNNLIVIILKIFQNNYKKFISDENLAFMILRYNELCVNVGRQLKIIEARREREGEGIEVTKEGVLLVRDSKGEVFSVNAGEVSVRGLYGYVE